MSYLALARKYRPRRFEDVVAQGHVVRALTHALAGDKLHPALLLTGTRGIGKTTLARIIAKGLNCETGVTATPCGACSACREVDEGRFVDLLEIDAASRTKVEETRNLLDNVQYAPVRGRYKVYLIDEVHMLSGHSFNALLKTLEEPPPHVKFILATTDPQKLPVTVLSRCLQFNLKRLPLAAIREQLGVILGLEKVQSDAGAVAELARAADGSMRDALSLLDQALAFCGGALTRERVEEMLGVGGRRVLYTLLRALAAGDGKALLQALQDLEAVAPDYASLLSDLAAALQRIALLQSFANARSDDDDAELGELAGTIPAEDTQLWYQIAVGGRRDLQWAPDPRLGFEMAVLRMLAFRPGGEVAERPRQQRAATAAAAPVAKPAAPKAAPASGGWAEQVETLGLEGLTRQLARHCAPIGNEGGVLRLALAAEFKHLLSPERARQIEAAAAAQGVAKQVRIEVGAAAAQETPVQAEKRAADAKQRAAEETLASDPTVAELRKRFGATIRPGSIQPVEK